MPLFSNILYNMPLHQLLSNYILHAAKNNILSVDYIITFLLYVIVTCIFIQMVSIYGNVTLLIQQSNVMSGISTTQSILNVYSLKNLLQHISGLSTGT